MAKDFADMSDHPINNGTGNYIDYYPYTRYREPQDDEEENEIPEDSILNENVVTVVNRGDMEFTNEGE